MQMVRRRGTEVTDLNEDLASSDLLGDGELLQGDSTFLYDDEGFVRHFVN